MVIAVEDKNDPNSRNPENINAPSYAVTITGKDIKSPNTNVDVNTSHSIEKYPEV
jgi:hypothetical protein